MFEGPYRTAKWTLAEHRNLELGAAVQTYRKA